MAINLKNSILYHYDKFPPKQLDYTKLVAPLTKATESLARYDQMLKQLPNSELLLAPLRGQDAVLTSRLEGTISTLDEILQYDAEFEENKQSFFRNEVIETSLYRKSLEKTQEAMKQGQPLSSFLLRQAHQTLLSHGGGIYKNPGGFKQEQNYLVDEFKKNVLFTPIAPEKLTDGLECLFKYLKNSEVIPLVRVAIAHVEFEALHPFQDGNGRIGRMLITLMLWSLGLISTPCFYLSSYFESNKNSYISIMRNVSANDNWDDWCVFFFEAVEFQAIQNLKMADQIINLYQKMKIPFSEILFSKWSLKILDFMFTNPIFRNSTLAKGTHISPQSVARFTKILLKENLITVIRNSGGSRGATYKFEPLLKLIRV